MAAVVGGRMEAVPPRRSLFAPDYLRLAVLAAVSVAVHGWLIGHTAVTARDSIGFARYAARVQSPRDANPPDNRQPTGEPPPARIETALDVIAAEKQAPGYPATVWLAAKFVRRGGPEHDHDRARLAAEYLLAAQLATAAAALLLVVPTYLIGRMLFGRPVGFAAALLLQVLPVPARVTSDGLSEGVYLLGLAVAVVLGVRALRRPAVGAFLLCGLAVGLSYLVRLEGLMVAGAVGAVVGWLGLTRRWPRDVALGRLTALAVGVTLIAGPYVLLIGKLTNKPTPGSMMPSVPGPRLKLLSGDAAPVGGPVFAAYWHVPDGSGPLRVAWPAAVGAVKETGKGLHYVGAVLALVGVLAHRRRVLADPGLLLLPVLVGVNFAVLIALGGTGYYVEGKRTFYVSERHTVFLVLVGCVFAAAALEPLAAALASVPRVGRLWAGRLAPAGLLAAVVAAALPATLKPLHEHREGHKHAGRWLAGQLQDDDCLIDPFEWAQWYAGRSLYYVPADPPNARVIYTVLDDKNRPDDHARLPRLDLARDVARSGTVVYHWPEHVPPEQAAVKVYRTTR